MNATTMGIGLAAVVAGPPLYALVVNGDMDVTSALERGGLVAIGCAAGVSLISRIVRGYEVQRRRTARQRHHDQAVAAALAELEAAPQDHGADRARHT
jgi:hypothetical protein